MSAAAPDYGPDGPPPGEDPDELVQMNVRVPRWLVRQLDERRGNLELSRDRWVTRALAWALKQPGRPERGRKTVARTERGRSVRPGGTR